MGNSDKKRVVVIVGLGVIGASYAMALRRAGFGLIYGVDVDERTLTKALEAGMIDEGGTDAGPFLERADLTILCLYPAAIRPFLEQYSRRFRAGSVITDTAGIKKALIETLSGAVPAQCDFVFGHPMAGREKRGIDYADYRVFQGANYLITPVSGNRRESIELVKETALCAGFGDVLEITPAQHDEIIAYTSQLTHAIAVALINSDEEGRPTGRYIGDSYRDLTRIANINEQLWSELFFANRDHLLKAIAAFEQQLDGIKNALHNGDAAVLRSSFEQSSARRQALDDGRKSNTRQAKRQCD